MRTGSILGYTFTALLYFLAWWNPAVGGGSALIRWVAFDKLCLTEFLTCHAITLLGGFALAARLDSEGGFASVFWVLVGFYFLLGTGAYAFHRDHGALLGFYAVLATRGMQLLSLRSPNPDVMRATVVKNFAMVVPMMILVGLISFSDDFSDPWQTAFLRGDLSLAQKVIIGRPVLFAAAYYSLWALVEWKWPSRMAQ